MRFDFSELCDLLGQPIDSASVLSMADRIGAKKPTPTTDANPDGYMAHKATGLEISWGHEVLLPDHYPPRRAGRQYVSWVNAIWFDPATVDHLPFNLPPAALAGALVEAVPERVVDDQPDSSTATLVSRPDLALTLPGTAQRWLLHGMQMRRYAVLSRNAAGNAPAGWVAHPQWPAAQMDRATGFFLYWCILNGYAGTRHGGPDDAQVDALRQRRASIMDYAYATCFEGELWSWDVCDALHDFSATYLNAFCHRNSAHPRFGKADRCHPDDDLVALLTLLAGKDVLDAEDEWALFDRFALVLDARWQDYQLTGLQTEVSRRRAMQLTALYRRMLEQVTAGRAPA